MPFLTWNDKLAPGINLPGSTRHNQVTSHLPKIERRESLLSFEAAVLEMCVLILT